jgi:carbon-monoxide dehydrogenase medium subunit
MYEFDYRLASSVEEAREWLAEDPEARLLAGGMTLLPAMKMRLSAPATVIDIGRLQDLKGICIDGDTVIIGALTTHAEVAESEVLRAAIPGLAELASHIGDAQVRNCGTIGGSLANNDPAADYPAAALALDAMICTTNRDIAAADFFVGMFETALEPGEVVLSVRFPIPDFAAYAKFPNPASRYAIVGVMVAKGSQGVRVAVTGAAGCVFRARAAEKALEEDFAEAALNHLVFPADGLNEDLHATAEYRAHLVMVMTRRAVATARP